MIKYGSVCSGIEAATVAWEPLGWKCQWVSEIEKFPCAVLKHHYPKVPNLGDMTRITEHDEFKRRPIDLLVGGTPCQSFSVAGLRKGLADPRGNLALHFLKVLDRERPRWVVWENVPGVLSSWSDEAGSFTDERGGKERGWQSNDFDTFTGGLRELGYGLAYRVLDAQHFGVPQRRRRVFVVGYLGDWRRAAAVLFESHCLSGHPAPSRQAGQGAPQDAGKCFTPSSHAAYAEGCGTLRKDGGDIGPGSENLIAGTLRGGSEAQGGSGITEDLALVAHSLRGEGYDVSEDGTGRGTPIIPILEAGARTGKSTDDPRAGIGIGKPGEPMFTIQSGKQHAIFDMRGRGDGEVCPTLMTDHASRPSDYCPIAFTQNQAGDVISGPNAPSMGTNQNATGRNTPKIQAGAMVRRLTPRECERLQGFPDDYTLLPGRVADGPRYKALGNSMAVPVMRWIGERIQMVENKTLAP